MTDNVQAIAAKSEDHGFAWEMSEVSTQGGKVSLGEIPIPRVTDAAKFAATFNLVGILNRSNSLTVQAQDIGRTAREKDHGAKADALKARIVAGMLGVRSQAPSKVYLLPDDSTTTDKAEFLAAWGIEGE